MSLLEFIDKHIVFAGFMIIVFCCTLVELVKALRGENK